MSFSYHEGCSDQLSIQLGGILILQFPDGQKTNEVDEETLNNYKGM